MFSYLTRRVVYGALVLLGVNLATFFLFFTVNTPDDMARLEAAKGVEFDRLFLEYMIRHHEGALTMVKDLFASPGAAQESEVFAFASDVEADQTAEIDRMGGMLNTLMKERRR